MLYDNRDKNKNNNDNYKKETTIIITIIIILVIIIIIIAMTALFVSLTKRHGQTKKIEISTNK